MATSNETGALFTITIDESGIVNVAAVGFWSPGDIEGHFADLKKATETARMRFGMVRVLVDLRASRVQSQEIFDRLRMNASALYAAEDRVAIVAQSALLTIQMRRLDNKAGRALFSTDAAARDWLLSS